MSSTLPDKLYFKIGEVAQVIGVRTSVLRFWESEFSFLKPEKSSTGQRLYSKNEVETIQQVKYLLYNEKYTIEGVRKRMGSKGKQAASAELLPQNFENNTSRIVKEVRQELKELRDLL